MATNELALWLGGAGTTVIGSVLAWVGQSRVAHRQRVWSVEDQGTARAHEEALRMKDIGEERFQRLRAERREVYGRLLDSVEETVEAIRDLRDTSPLPEIEVSTVPELATAHPIAARALACMTRQRRMDSDVVLIADPGVRDSALELSKVLRHAFREALAGRDALTPANAQLLVVVKEMRAELVGRA